ncbi:serine/threonine protein kinase [Oculatella sp. FACHB-28]|uniref:WD40 repeat domain-containing serine/threonine protein kinase n=1 Tax=Oculatella sp. FACHB-28 TaxID=2692845 RepID=UPI001682A22B|nr:serine/threonine-protein kinase [Oculatella sp. FACHB-28]MBD2057715.1 serine/threonine protein kinase [Oculatella sp. FACHB-28]
MPPSQPLDTRLGRPVGDRQRYLLTDLISNGGMGDVFLATDSLLGQHVALKVLNERLVVGELRKRFEREVAVIAALQSDHIVQVMDYGVTAEGNPFYVMEYLHGQTLGQLLRQEKRLSVPRTVSIIHQVCSGLFLAHQGVQLRQEVGVERVKVVHRDLKPDNIFLVTTTLGEWVKILDFGIAKIRSDRSEQTHVTEMFLGTFRYAAPEQHGMEENLDERADIYSLGIILYEMLSGSDPYSFDPESKTQHRLTGVEWAVAHLTKSPLPLRQQSGCDDISPAVEAVVMKCLEKAPADRFASVMELNQALRAAFQNGDRIPTAARKPIKPRKPAEAEPTMAVSPPLPTPVPNAAAKVSLMTRFALLLAGSGITAVLLLAAGSYAGWSPFLGTSKFDALEEVSNSSLTPASVIVQEPQSAAAQSLSGHMDTVWAVAISPDGQTLASASFDRTVKFWNPLTGELLQTVNAHSDAVRAIAYSPDGKTLASGSGDKTIRIWDLQTQKLVRTLSGHSGPIWSIAISPDGQTLASGSYDGTIKLWNPQTGELRQTLTDHYDSIWSVAISPDGKTLASCSYDGTIKLWNLQDGKLLRTLSGHSDAVRAIAISPDGEYLVSGSWDKTARVWDLQTGQVLHVLEGHEDRVLAVAISPDGNTIATGSTDHSLKTWNLQTGRLLRSLNAHADWVLALTFSPDGRTLVSGSKDKTIKIWDWR